MMYQIGKKGLTPEFIEALKVTFKREENLKISILKSFSRDREKAIETAEKIVSSLNDKKFIYNYKIIGFTIVLFRMRRHSVKSNHKSGKINKNIKSGESMNKNTNQKS